jgi:hypothetical protein
MANVALHVLGTSAAEIHRCRPCQDQGTPPQRKFWMCGETCACLPHWSGGRWTVDGGRLTTNMAMVSGTWSSGHSIEPTILRNPRPIRVADLYDIKALKLSASIM